MKTNDDKVVQIIKVVQKGKGIKYSVTYKMGDSTEDIIFLEDQIVNFRILKGKEYTLEEWQEIVKSSNTSEWFGKTLNFLSFKSRTKKEIIDYLKKGELSFSDIQIIVKKLEDMNLINDYQYAQDFLNEIINKKKGLKYYEYQLSQKGIDNNIIEEVSRKYSFDIVKEDLLRDVQQKQEKLISYPIIYQKQKIMDKLLRDGFPNNMITEIFNQVKWTSETEARLIMEIEKIQKNTDDKNKIIQKLLQKGYSYQEIKSMIKSE